jgi:hypothetical protein
MTVHLMRGPDTGYEDIAEDRLFSRYEQYLFSKVVALAEKAGKTVHLLVVPSSDIFQAIAMTAARLAARDIVAGRSSWMTPEQQAKQLGEAWEHLPNKPHQRVRFRVIGPSEEIKDFYLGAHAPDLTDEEIQFIHELWLDITRENGLDGVRHKDIVMLALGQLREQLKGGNRKKVINRFQFLKRKPHEGSTTIANKSSGDLELAPREKSAGQ